MTSLFHDIIFGPVHSRRLGLSLGVNLLPTESKLCSFDCIYCECGWNAEHPGARRFNTREDVRTQLAATLRRMVADGTPPDVITFAGNGEPTMHPEFEAVIGDTIALRDELCPSPGFPCFRTPRSSTARACAVPFAAWTTTSSSSIRPSTPRHA